jgi:hypothetical protein
MARLPTLKRPTVISTGPKLYRSTEEPQRYGPPGEPPLGFVTPKTSATEWPPYWGLAHIFGYPKPEHVRSFPFNGGPPYWEYQGFVEASSDKQTNVDFIIWGIGNASPIAIRIQTEFFHNFASNDTQFYDIVQRDRLQNGFEVVDLYDYEYMRDETGRAVIVLLKQAMGLIETPNPIRSGAVQRV